MGTTVIQWEMQQKIRQEQQAQQEKKASRPPIVSGGVADKIKSMQDIPIMPFTNTPLSALKVSYIIGSASSLSRT